MPWKIWSSNTDDEKPERIIGYFDKNYIINISEILRGLQTKKTYHKVHETTQCKDLPEKKKVE